MRKRIEMRKYQAIRISVNGRPTYGDKYLEITASLKLNYNEIISVGNDRYLILFEI